MEISPAWSVRKWSRQHSSHPPPRPPASIQMTRILSAFVCYIVDLLLLIETSLPANAEKKQRER